MKGWLAAVAFFLCYVQVVFADCNPTSGTITINSDDDAAAVTTCTTLTGDVVIATSAPESIILDGVQSISGKIVVENVAQLQSLSASTLQSVQSLSFNNLPNLSNLSFPALRNFSSVHMNALTALEACTIATGDLEAEINEIFITNTSLKSLDWLTWPVGSTLNISNNANLQSFGLVYGSINAASSITLDGNPVLENISFPSLGSINGAFDISNNNALKSLAFGDLQSIGGYVQLSGAFNNITMPVLNDIHGGLSIQSTDNIQSFCSDLQNKTASGVISGHYQCVGEEQGSPTSTATATPSSTGSNAPSTSTPAADSTGSSRPHVSKGAKIGLGLGFALATTLAIAFAVLYYRRRSIKSRARLSSDTDEDDRKSIELTGLTPPSELASTSTLQEMPHGRHAHELPVIEPFKELDGFYSVSELETPTTPVSPWERARVVSRDVLEMPA